jgi:hypothetical protein
MEYDLSKDSPEERERKRRALSDRYKEKGTLEKIKKGVSDWWDENEARRTGTLKDYYKNKR